MLDVQSVRLYQLNEQGKGPFLRQTKHFEETSELAEAVVCQDAPENILGEAVDGLLMLLSIAADYLPVEKFHSEMTGVVVRNLCTHWDQWQPLDTETHPMALGLTTLQYISTLQYITTAVQRFEGVASSQYKGEVESSLIIDAIAISIDALSQVIVLVPQELGQLQQIYNEKMDKWEKVSK